MSKKHKLVTGAPIVGTCTACKTKFTSKYEAKRHACRAAQRQQLAAE